MINRANLVSNAILQCKAAAVYASASKAVRRKVGAVLCSGDRPISSGFNGMPLHLKDTPCETVQENGSLLTRPELVHAEVATYQKLFKSSETTESTELYVTASPCIKCARYITENTYTTHVFFSELFREMDGVWHLFEEGFFVYYVDLETESVYQVHSDKLAKLDPEDGLTHTAYEPFNIMKGYDSCAPSPIK